MALLDDIKLSLRVSTSALDAEVEMLVGAAIRDMERVGVDPGLLPTDASDDCDDLFVKTAIAAYCKAHFGYDNQEANRFDDSYRRIVCDLLNSSDNIADVDEGGE